MLCNSMAYPLSGFRTHRQRRSVGVAIRGFLATITRQIPSVLADTDDYLNSVQSKKPFGFRFSLHKILSVRTCVVDISIGLRGWLLFRERCLTTCELLFR